MIVICTHKSPDILERFLSSIKNHQTENHKILIVETSDSQDSKVLSEKYQCLFSNTNLKYEIGAYVHAINLYPDEDEYFLFQDSLEIVNDNWEDNFRKLSQGEKLVTLCGYFLKDDPCPGCGVEEFESLFNCKFPTEEGYAVMTNSFYITQSAKQKLKNFGIDRLFAHEKNDTYKTERILGAMAHYTCGIADLSELLGNYIWQVDQFLPGFGFTKFILKHIRKRQ